MFNWTVNMERESAAGATLAAEEKRAGRISYEEFLQRPDENRHAEWVEGKVVLMSPVSKEHQDLGAFLISLLRHYAEAKRLGRILYEPFQMKTGPELPGRSPDILFVASANLGRLKRLHLEGPADLVIEIISPESRARDRGEKFYEYEQGGVPEYWLLDPERRQAEFYYRESDGIYRPAPVEPGGIYRSKALPGLWLRVDWLWQQPLPAVLDVLKEWGLV
jgi:Uma2 family endonuclease